MEATVNAVCRECGSQHEMKAFSKIDVSSDPQLKQQVISGELFTWTCGKCGKVNLVKYPLIYLDRTQKVLLVLSDASLSVEQLPEGFAGRRVRGIGELVEKIKIFDAGLDDVAIELCKYVTLAEMGRKAELRFLKLEGADNEMIFTYPEKGEMQMLSVGFNVYEDARGILARHSSIRAEGLQTVDQDWIGSVLA